jgi:glyoxylase-like metal-dependent hydrolase (beta-lactamase superfamily II)
MRDIRAIVVLFLSLAATVPAVAQNEDLEKVQIKTTQVAADVYLLQGDDAGNIAASVGEDGIVLVDDEFAPLASKIAASLKALGITDKPVRFVLNTHHHFDHTGGNVPFAQGGATIIAHDNVRRRLIEGGRGGNGGSMHLDQQPPGKKDALPIITFEHQLTVHLNGEDIQALHYPAAHTDGDIVIYFPKANVVHMGDDYVRYGFPFIDVEAGGSVQGMIKACDDVLQRLPANVKIIPGHGELSNADELRQYVGMLKATSAAVARALQSGKTMDQMKREQVLADWSRQYSGDFISTDAFIETLYYSLTHAKRAPYRKHN